MNQNDPTGTIKTHLIGALDGDGNVVPVALDNLGGGGGGGDASAANQETQIDALEAIQQQTTAFDGVDSFFSVAYSALQLFINVGSKYENVATDDTGSWSLLQFFKRLLFVKLAVKTQVPTFINTTTSGTIATGATSVAIANNGNATGTVNGIDLPPGVTINFQSNWINVLGAISYNATGTTFLIQEVR